jgi:hypothetical protein
VYSSTRKLHRVVSSLLDFHLLSSAWHSACLMRTDILGGCILLTLFIAKAGFNIIISI